MTGPLIALAIGAGLGAFAHAALMAYASRPPRITRVDIEPVFHENLRN